MTSFDMSITCEQWTSNLIEACEMIADSKKQEERWLASDAFAWERPEELICVLFDDNQFDLFIQEYAAVFSDEQAKAATNLRDEMDRFNEQTPTRLDAKEVLSDPRWESIRGRARAFIEAFRTQTVT